MTASGAGRRSAEQTDSYPGPVRDPPVMQRALDAAMSVRFLTSVGRGVSVDVLGRSAVLRWILRSTSTVWPLVHAVGTVT